MKRVISIGLLVFALVAVSAVLLVSRKGKAVQNQSAPAVAVDTARPVRTSIARYVEIYGTLSPKNAAEVKSEIPARILRMKVKEWESVDEKDLLLELDPTDLKLNLAKNEAGLKMARAQLVQAQVDSARAKREWNRTQKLKEGGLATGQELDERKTALESADARAVLANAQVAQAESQVAEARHSLEKTCICSPIKGTVQQRKVDAGDWVDKGALLFSIVDNRVLDFTANVAAIDLCSIKEGQQISFTVDGLAGRVFQGRVKRINPMVASADRTGRVQAEVENADGVLKSGLFARGRIKVEESRDVLALPRAALANWDINRNTARVFVVSDGAIANLREVATGIEDGNMVEIRSGLDGGEKVVTRGGFNLRDGDRVSDAGSPGGNAESR